MHSDDKLTFGIIGVFLSFFALMFVLAFVDDQKEREARLKALEAGVDPLAAMCVLK